MTTLAAWQSLIWQLALIKKVQHHILVFYEKIIVLQVVSAAILNIPKQKFESVFIHMGDARERTSKKNQCLAYCNSIGRKPDFGRRQAAVCRFGPSFFRSNGPAKFSSLVSKMQFKGMMQFVDSSVFIFTSISNPDRLGLFRSRLAGQITFP